MLPPDAVEVSVIGGRVDLVTEATAWEVGRLTAWQNNLGQALHYAHALDLEPGVALIDGPLDPAVRELIGNSIY